MVSRIFAARGRRRSAASPSDAAEPVGVQSKGVQSKGVQSSGGAELMGLAAVARVESALAEGSGRHRASLADTAELPVITDAPAIAPEAPPAPKGWDGIERRSPGRLLRGGFRGLLRSLSTAFLSAYISLTFWALLPVVAGWTPAVIVSGSMAPLIKPGDVVFFQPQPADSIALGRVVLVADPSRGGRLVSHRLYDRKADGTLILMGDANRGPDSTPVPASSIRGAARLIIPYVGRVTLWNTPHRDQAALWTGLIAAALLFARKPLPPRKYRKARVSNGAAGEPPPPKHA